MNKKILTPLFVLASFLLIGCSADKIVARPDWINEDIVDGDFKNNKMKEIYDAIKELGDTNANVLNKVMYDIAQNQLGHFKDYEDKEGNHLGIKSIATKDTITDSEIDEFVNKYPVYKSEDIAYQLDGSGNPKKVDITDNPNEKRKISVNKIKKQYERIMDNIYESLFNDIKGGEYSSKIDKLFQEEYFVQHLYKEMYDVGEITAETKFVTNRVFIPRGIVHEEEGKKINSWEDYVNVTDLATTNHKGFLQVTKNGEFTDFYDDYITRKVLPEIYRTLLIENYVKEQRYTNLGRSYARKVKMLTVPHNSNPDVTANIQQMLYDFAEANAKPDSTWSDYNLDNIGYAMNGFAAEDGSAQEQIAFDLLDSRFKKLELPASTETGKAPVTWTIRTDDYGQEIEDGKDTNIYIGTKLEELFRKYLKIHDVTWVPDPSPATTGHFKYTPKSYLTADELTAYNDLTSNGTISLERGLVLKEREIRLNSMTKEGWFLKSSGLTDLDKDFSDDLFNITTSKIIDIKTGSDDIKQDDTVRYFGNKDKEKGRYINRKAFLFAKQEGGEPASHSIVLDGESNFFIVEVEEAGSASKFSQESVKDSYLELKATTELGASNDAYDEIVRKVTKEVASGETYKKNAEQYYLMISNIIFYDQSVYDYFKSQFPELFK